MTNQSHAMKNFALIITFPTHPAIVRWFGTLAAAQAAQRNHAKGNSQMTSYTIVSEEEFNSY